ncbi:head GIN domain-containing protein [Undibacterium sp. 5I1]|uniref:head GIN domain-containing protein n=1 Tax=unclassified Undibacterium TaxID=2630295 RepID=UPI002AB43463|nr:MULTISPECIES: head GIN domain-containing protein [unclassified Undibacterium]MDY7538908.1 head GIN domain-containing protein [Undibacterium sp. 5I1]MEB0232703.1 head GIN domain-containing protein [Undibacterium sp. 10I3]MEB0257785.1 head GIN domain-containing protein [Undibacterium sp. 5I1]
MNMTRFAKRVFTISLTLSALAIVAQPKTALASGWNLQWSSDKSIAGSGKLQQENRAASHFNAISISLPAEIELQQGNAEGISIETDDNLLTLIETTVENGTLKVRTLEKEVHLDTRSLKIIIKLKQIDDLEVAGSGSLRSSRLQADKLRVTIGGSGTVKLQGLSAESLLLTIGGSGSFKIAGNANTTSMAIGGSGSMDGSALKTNDAKVSIGGSGKVSVATRDNLKVSIGGSGTVNYYGNPQVSKSIGGSGSVVRLGDFPS